MSAQTKAAPGWTPESGSIKTPDAGNSKPHAGLLATQAKAAAINAAHAEARAHAARAVERAIEAGDLLLEVKDSLPHGEWLPWLEIHCPDISRRTAQGYMRLARDLPTEMRNAAHLTLNGAMRLLAPPRPEPRADLLNYLETVAFWNSDLARAAFMMDAAGWPVARIVEVIAANCTRFGHATAPEAEEVAAWLNPHLTERPSCCVRSHRDPKAAYPEGADAEDLYRLAVRYNLDYYQLSHYENAAMESCRLGFADLKASLQGSIRVISRRMVKPREPATLLEQAAHTAALIDANFARFGLTPEDGWNLPIGMWSVICLRLATEESGPLWRGARFLFTVPVTAEAVEALPLFKAAEVLLEVAR